MTFHLTNQVNIQFVAAFSVQMFKPMALLIIEHFYHVTKAYEINSQSFHHVYMNRNHVRNQMTFKSAQESLLDALWSEQTCLSQFEDETFDTSVANMLICLIIDWISTQVHGKVIFKMVREQTWRSPLVWLKQRWPVSAQQICQIYKSGNPGRSFQ